MVRSGVALVAQLGILVSGSGEMESEIECSDPSLCDEGSDKADYDDTSGFGMELDVLFHVGPSFRLGFGFIVVPTAQIEPDGSSTDVETGTEVAPLFVAEGVFGSKAAGYVRGFGGLDVIFAGDDTDELIEDFEDACDSAPSGVDCDVRSGPFLGYTLGVGGGVLGQVDPSVGLRAGMTIQYLYLTGPGMEVSEAGEDAEVSTNQSGTRFWLTAGLEF